MKLRKIVKLFLWMAFSVYCLVLLEILFLNRPGHADTNWRHFVNLVPFKTISGYIKLYFRESGGTAHATRNLFGNFLLFFPMTCFLPALFRCLRKPLWNLLLLFGILLLVESTQLLLRVGSFDVDDILLNFLGGVLGCILVSIPPMRRLLQKIAIFDKN